MPHLPKATALATTTSLPPEIHATGRRPPRTAWKPLAGTPAKPARRTMLGTVSLAKHNVPPERVFAHLYGGLELKTDEHSGESKLVPRPT